MTLDFLSLVSFLAITGLGLYFLASPAYTTVFFFFFFIKNVIVVFLFYLLIFKICTITPVTEASLSTTSSGLT